MTPNAAQPAERLQHTLWAMVAVWFAVAVLLCGSVAEAGHVHLLTVRGGAPAAHAAAVTQADGNGQATCVLCLLDGCAVQHEAKRGAPAPHRSAPVPQHYGSRAVPLAVPFARSIRPPPAA